MKRYLAIALLLLPVSAQPNPLPAKTTPAKPAKTAAKPAVTVSTGIPAGAVEVGPNLYKLADKTGKVWFYRRTPFGASRFEERTETTSAESAKYAAQVPETQVSEQGDTVKFVRPGPFGNYTWAKKKVEMDESEMASYEAWQLKIAGQQNAAKVEKVEPELPQAQPAPQQKGQ